VARPVSVLIDTFGTETADTSKILRAVNETFDFRPKAMIDQLQLLRPVFVPTAAYGHFGRTGDSFTWEKTDRVEALKSAL
jgi:S-adenosylmethionine synthetase